MKRLDIETWKNIFRNTRENDEEIEVIYLDNIGDPGEWCLCVDCELFEDSFNSENEARERLNYLEKICL